MTRIAIIGRPNVGKSALFNRLIKKRKAIVFEEPGVTRDVISRTIDYDGQIFEIMDTGGIQHENDLQKTVSQQAMTAAQKSDIILLVVDAMAGLVPADEEVSEILLRLREKVLVVVNKVDGQNQENLISEFYQLGYEQLFGVSALHGRGFDELLDYLVRKSKKFPASSESSDDEIKIEDSPSSIRVAILGRPNVGKSTFINQILDEERVVVSDMPGTTMDSVDVILPYKDQIITFVDTAGLRRKRSIKKGAEKISTYISRSTIKEADICILMLKAEDTMTQQDNLIFRQIIEEGKGCIIAINQWDKLKDVRMEHYIKDMWLDWPNTSFIPILCISALEKRNLDKMLEYILQVYHNLDQTFTTPELNQWLENTIRSSKPQSKAGQIPKIYYMTQVRTNPIEFILFVNHREYFRENYILYLESQLRKRYHLEGVPIRFILKNRRQQKTGKH